MKSSFTTEASSSEALDKDRSRGHDCVPIARAAERVTLCIVVQTPKVNPYGPYTRPSYSFLVNRTDCRHPSGCLPRRPGVLRGHVYETRFQG